MLWWPDSHHRWTLTFMGASSRPCVRSLRRRALSVCMPSAVSLPRPALDAKLQLPRRPESTRIFYGTRAVALLLSFLELVPGSFQPPVGFIRRALVILRMAPWNPSARRHTDSTSIIGRDFPHSPSPILARVWGHMVSYREGSAAGRRTHSTRV
ncbi:uncharacterized protein C8Q71DRAFT_126517 [Rhodofomes roseus]|uniref:Uncharacterized protein n=1 Tax=Rhodofomes roseus TaxID=34475 RepID=A0ABQ8KBB4_9APHY|nr:uncharacterized protein C8Q71DRAFT_126517 [Rhodofomes roseus]KAH9834826.1 hypothetical protein C8Q71DRAFT_126517 [Rhodofomes roseus]